MRPWARCTRTRVGAEVLWLDQDCEKKEDDREVGDDPRSHPCCYLFSVDNEVEGERGRRQPLRPWSQCTMTRVGVEVLRLDQIARGEKTTERLATTSDLSMRATTSDL